MNISVHHDPVQKIVQINCSYNTIQLRTTTTSTTTLQYNYNCNCNYNYIALHYNTLHSAVVVEVTTATCPKSRTPTTFRSESQQLTSPIVSYLWNFGHHLVRYSWYQTILHRLGPKASRGIYTGDWKGMTLNVSVWKHIFDWNVAIFE
jgi:hypothetical protein